LARESLVPYAATLLLMAAGCAQGFSAEAAAPPAPPPAGAAAPFFGEACMVGERSPCTCPNGGDQGVKACSPDEASPTKGSYSTCLLCVAAAGTGAAVGGAGVVSGVAGTGVAAGSTRATAAGTSSATDGGGRTGSTNTLRAGTGGSTGKTGSSGGRCMCNQSCFPLGIVACCRPNGSCGCTWAAGAYCM
jgi:hypothetical protein